MTDTSGLPKLRSIKWVAAYFERDEQTILRWIHEGKLKSSIINRRHHISEEEIIRFVREQNGASDD